MSRTPIIPKTQLGKWLKAWRLAEPRSLGPGKKKKIFTQTDAAAFFAMPMRTYQEIEDGRSPGTAFTRHRLEQVVKPKTTA
jgi:hypothetical protein